MEVTEPKMYEPMIRFYEEWVERNAAVYRYNYAELTLRAGNAWRATIVMGLMAAGGQDPWGKLFEYGATRRQ